MPCCAVSPQMRWLVDRENNDCTCDEQLSLCCALERDRRDASYRLSCSDAVNIITLLLAAARSPAPCLPPCYRLPPCICQRIPASSPPSVLPLSTRESRRLVNRPRKRRRLRKHLSAVTHTTHHHVAATNPWPLRWSDCAWDGAAAVAAAAAAAEAALVHAPAALLPGACPRRPQPRKARGSCSSRGRKALTGPVLLALRPASQLLKHRPLEIADMGVPGELASSKPTVAALHAEFGEDFSQLRDEDHLVRALDAAAWDHTTTLAYALAALNTLFMYAPAFVVRVLTGAVEGNISVPGDVVRAAALRCTRAPGPAQSAALTCFRAVSGVAAAAIAEASCGRSRRCCSCWAPQRPCARATPCATSTSMARGRRAR